MAGSCCLNALPILASPGVHLVVDRADYLHVNAVTVYPCLHCVLLLLQMEKEKRKRAASRAPKQRINKKGRSEKPAVTQGRRSKFTAMSAQTMTSEDDDGDTYQHRRLDAFTSNTAADNKAYRLQVHAMQLNPVECCRKGTALVTADSVSCCHLLV